MVRRALLALAVGAVLALSCAVLVAAADDMDEVEIDASSPDFGFGGVGDDVNSGADAAAGADDDAEPAPEDHSVAYNPSTEGLFFAETFQSEDPFTSGRVVKSDADKYMHQMLKIDVPTLFSGIAGDKGLIATTPAKHYGATMPFSKPLVVGAEDDFVLQYEVRLQQGLECGGAYLKVPMATDEFEPSNLDSETPYVVMFGPDKCGSTNKVHFIMRHQNPVTNEWIEHHLNAPPMPKSDKHSHLYTLHIRADNTFTIKIDDAVAFTGSLLEDMEPPINPPKEIPDPEDEKPDDWVDEAKIADPEAVKPDDWDESQPATIPDESAVKPEGWLDDAEEYIPDPESEKPEDWDEEEDGEYEPPLVPNPACEEAPGCGEWVRPMMKNPLYKGKWSAPMIDNPEYQGEWAPRNIPNPAYFVDEDPHQMAPMAGVAVEIWTMTGGLFFDNVVADTDAAKVSGFAQATWAPRHAAQVAREEAQRARIARKQREEAFKTGGVMGKINYFVLEAMDLAVQNPIPSIITILIAFVSIIYLCCMGGSSESRQRRPRSTYRAPATSAATGDDGAADDGDDGGASDGNDGADADDNADAGDDAGASTGGGAAADDDGDDDDEGTTDDDEGDDEDDDDSDDDDDDDGADNSGSAQRQQRVVRKRSTKRVKRTGD